jgi:type VI protein secretion system component VasK
MSYITERFDQIASVLDADDRKVVEEYIGERVHEARARAERPPWVAILGVALVVGVALVDGWPRACNVANDNTIDTVRQQRDEYASRLAAAQADAKAAHADADNLQRLLVHGGCVPPDPAAPPKMLIPNP